MLITRRNRISKRTFLLALVAVSALFMHGNLPITSKSLTYCNCVESIKVMAITEDENEVSLRDANSSKERPRLDGFDMD